MKKILTFLAISVMLVFASCSEGNNYAGEKTETAHYKDGTQLQYRRFKFQGHTYIEFTRIAIWTYDNMTGYVHDPDCPCGKGK